MNHSHTKPRTRRWSKFGIRSLFLLLTCFAFVFGFWIYPSTRQSRIVQSLIQRGYLVRYDLASELPTDKLREFIRRNWGKDYLYDVHSVTMWSEEDGRAKSEDLPGIAQLKSLRELVLYSGQLQSGDLKQIQNLKDLWRLELLVEGITDVDLRDISKLNLRKINLGDLPISDEGVKYLEGMDSLNMLKLDGTNITDRAIGYFDKLPKLDFLGLRGTRITDAGIKQIANAVSRDNITTLMLYSTDISTNGFQHLPGLANLTYLDAENTKLDDQSLPYIAKLGKLQTLNLSFTKVTADGLSGLDLPNLTTLELRGTKIQPNDVTEFKRRHPKCSIRL